VVVARWVQLVMLPIGFLFLWVLVHAASGVFVLFIVAGLIALILNPLVSAVHLGRMPRGLAVGIVYLTLIGSVATAGALLVTPITDQVTSFQEAVPGIERSANKNLAELERSLNDKGIHVKIAKQGDTALQTLSKRVLGGTDSIVSTGTDIATRVVTAGLSLILIFVLSIYMLLYGQQIGDLVRRIMPSGDGTPEDDYPTRVQKAVAGYVRGQTLFSLAMGTGAGVSLYVFGLLGIFPLGETYALAFGIFFGLMELIPFVGPFLGALPPVLVALFSDPISALWVGLLFVALQQIEGHIVAPQIFSHTLRINPLLVIFALLVGAEVAGFVGALLALPIAAIIRETLDYLRRHLVLEPWAVSVHDGLGGLSPPPGPGRDAADPLAATTTTTPAATEEPPPLPGDEEHAGGDEEPAAAAGDTAAEQRRVASER
jgi:predicted PurR-regulated permease PerM